ncbi:erythromycin esterase family protein [Herbidospora mongoliensis]|uniref:erythromycin esterase family protein n=1 Tax=Herbidospora mongoliensis TaxID=688067 RepID=UPI000835CF7E|nr:erythromycin esterase family protein [Herbidospora mongoliensis]
MSQEILDFVPSSCELLGLGEPTHTEPAFGWLRNEFLARLAAGGFRSIALETGRTAALLVDDYVQGGPHDLDTVMRDGFTHGWGEKDHFRALVTWMRDHNEKRPPADRLTFHGFDAATENYNAPSPRRHLEHARDHLGLDVDFAGLLGDDERWHRTEAIMDYTESPGASPGARQARVVADDMLVRLYAQAPEGPRADWIRAKTHLTTGIGLLRYHAEAAVPRADPRDRMVVLLGVRDVLMAENLFDIRDVEARRGRTFVFAHNAHLQKNPSTWKMGDRAVTWHGAGSIIASLWGERYAFIAASLGRSRAVGLADPDPGTYEGRLGFSTWGLTTDLPEGATRTDTTPQQGYFPLTPATLDGADALLHVGDPDA